MRSLKFKKKHPRYGWIWLDMVGLEHKPEMARNIFRIAADILFHRITRETMNYEWLLGFLKEIKLLIKGMDKESK